MIQNDNNVIIQTLSKLEFILWKDTEHRTWDIVKVDTGYNFVQTGFV